MVEINFKLLITIFIIVLLVSVIYELYTTNFTKKTKTIDLALVNSLSKFLETNPDSSEMATFLNDDNMKDQLKKIVSEYLKSLNVQKHINNIDEFDFKIFTKQDWTKINDSHSKDIKVHWPDESVSNGIDEYVNDLKYLFTYAPDTSINEHPIKFGFNDWTCVIGKMTGRFTKPMLKKDGSTVQPTGKAFNISICTLFHWNKAGLIDEKYKFWDNASYMKQMGAI